MASSKSDRTGGENVDACSAELVGSLSVSEWFVHAAFEHPGGELSARAEVDFAEDVGHVSLSCRHCDHQLLGDLTIAPPARDKRGCFQLPRCERVTVAPALGRR